MSSNASVARGPLAGLRVVEFAGLGPAPFACMLLADMGADVVLVDRPGARTSDPLQIVNRGRTVVAADLKAPADKEQVLALLDAADVLVEGFRPGVMERLGLGPEVVLARNPKLVYGRMTGWGQEGPLAKTAGHDVNYIALIGARRSGVSPARWTAARWCSTASWSPSTTTAGRASSACRAGCTSSPHPRCAGGCSTCPSPT